MKSFICMFMAVLLTNAPHVASAEVAGEMIATSAIVEQMGRAENEAKIVDLLSREEVQSQLQSFGLKKEEISARLATLTDSEIKDLTEQVDKAQFGGDAVIGLLVVVVLVLLVIFLAKRI